MMKTVVDGDKSVTNLAVTADEAGLLAEANMSLGARLAPFGITCSVCVLTLKSHCLASVLQLC